MRLILIPGLWLVFACGLPVPAAPASELSEFHTAFADAWGHYRQASFYVDGAGNVAVAAVELDEFVVKWSALATEYGNHPPDTFADDATWAGTLGDIGSRARAGLESLDAGDIEAARAQLRPIRGIAGELRRRNGVVIHADRIDELSAAMDLLARYRREVKELSDPQTVAMVAKQAAIVGYLFEKCDRLAPPAVARDPEFRRQIDGAKESMNKLRESLRVGGISLYRVGIGELRSYERILFFRFG